jgi:hypothetical protein
MSKPKRHHYVPQFYLRRFSDSGRFIECFVKNNRRMIPKAPIRGQCAINNFYSWNEEVESSLGFVEGRAASIFRTIDQECSLPPRDSFLWTELLTFIALQSSRTQLSGQDSDDLADYYGKLIVQMNPNYEGQDLSNIKIGARFPAALPMQAALNSLPYIEKLGRCLLRNNTNIPFFSSDNPVVFYNSRFSHLHDIGVIGISSHGLQIFYPISPNLTIFLFDPDAYKIPSNTETKFLRASDVNQINLLQYMWSGKVIFPGKSGQLPLLTQMSKICDDYLPFKRSVTIESEIVPNKEGGGRSLLLSFRAHNPIETQFEFIRPDTLFDPPPSLIRGAPMPLIDIGECAQSYEFKNQGGARQHLKGSYLTKALSTLKNPS